MTTNYPSKDASGKKVSKTLSAKQSTKDLTNWDIERYIKNNHVYFYPKNTNAWKFSQDIGGFYNQRRGCAFPSEEALAELWQISERTVRRHVRSMREAVDANGNPLWKIVIGHNMGETNSTNCYYPLFLEDILASLNESNEVDEAEAVSLEHDTDDADEPNSGLNASDDDMDTQALESDESVSGVHDLFDDVEAVFDAPATSQEQEAQAETTYVLPASWLMQSDEQMMAKVLALVKREKDGESKTPYTKPPALDGETFTNLEVSNQRFLNAFIRYIMHLGNTSQDELNAAAANMVEQWSREKASGSSTFYLKFLSEYLKTWKGFM